MNVVLAVVVAVLIYPGVLAAVVATWALGWMRDAARAATRGTGRPGLLSGPLDLRTTFGREALAPEGAAPWLLAFAPVLATAAPVAALVLLPVPGNPLVGVLGLTGDLIAEGTLLLGMPLMRLLVGWSIPSPYGRLAADRGARLLAGSALPMALALVAIAQLVGTLRLSVADAPQPGGLQPVVVLARVLAAGAFACCLPVLARYTALREGSGELDVVAGELTELSGRDLGLFRLAEGIQLVAACGFFVAAFVLPALAGLLTARFAPLAWIVGLVLTALGVGAWEGARAGRVSAAGDQPPLSWWFGLPLLLALFALVLAAWAVRVV
jgi:formate hydrogenlyase subunit 4